MDNLAAAIKQYSNTLNSQSLGNGTTVKKKKKARDRDALGPICHLLNCHMLTRQGGDVPVVVDNVECQMS